MNGTGLGKTPTKMQIDNCCKYNPNGCLVFVTELKRPRFSLDGQRISFARYVAALNGMKPPTKAHKYLISVCGNGLCAELDHLAWSKTRQFPRATPEGAIKFAPLRNTSAAVNARRLNMPDAYLDDVANLYRHRDVSGGITRISNLYNVSRSKVYCDAQKHRPNARLVYKKSIIREKKRGLSVSEIQRKLGCDVGQVMRVLAESRLLPCSSIFSMGYINNQKG